MKVSLKFLDKGYKFSGYKGYTFDKRYTISLIKGSLYQIQRRQGVAVVQAQIHWERFENSCRNRKGQQCSFSRYSASNTSKINKENTKGEFVDMAERQPPGREKRLAVAENGSTHTPKMRGS